MTNLDIANMALGFCGHDPLTIWGDQTSAGGRQIAANYLIVRDAVLEDFEWTFAVKRLLLQQDGGVPAFGYSYQYILPSTVLRVVQCYDSAAVTLDDPCPIEFVREGPFILTNVVAPVYCRAIMRVDEGVFSPGMSRATAHLLAAEIAVPLTESRALAKDHADLYESVVAHAAARDGAQGSTQRMMPPRLPGRRR